MKRSHFLTAACIMALTVKAASAAPVFFDDAFQNGSSNYNTTGTVVASPAPTHTGDMAIQYVATAAYDQRGVDLNQMVVSVPVPQLSFDLYVTSGNEGTVMVGGPPNYNDRNFNAGTNLAYWTFDGVSGTIAPTALRTASLNQWHHVTLDLAGAFGAAIATGGQVFSLRIQNESPSTFYMDNVQLVTVPEPASIAALGLLSLCLVRRRRAAK